MPSVNPGNVIRESMLVTITKTITDTFTTRIIWMYQGRDSDIDWCVGRFKEVPREEAADKAAEATEVTPVERLEGVAGRGESLWEGGGGWVKESLVIHAGVLVVGGIAAVRNE